MSEAIAQQQRVSRGGTRAARAALFAAALELVGGLILCVVVLGVLATQVASPGELVVNKLGRPTPFVAALALVAMIVVPQGLAAVALAQRAAWARTIGVVIALAVALLCIAFLGALALSLVLAAAAGRPSPGGDPYDAIFAYGAIIPAAAVLVLNARAVTFAVRDWPR